MDNRAGERRGGDGARVRKRNQKKRARERKRREALSNADPGRLDAASGDSDTQAQCGKRESTGIAEKVHKIKKPRLKERKQAEGTDENSERAFSLSCNHDQVAHDRDRKRDGNEERTKRKVEQDDAEQRPKKSQRKEAEQQDHSQVMNRPGAEDSASSRTKHQVSPQPLSNKFLQTPSKEYMPMQPSRVPPTTPRTPGAPEQNMRTSITSNSSVKRKRQSFKMSAINNVHIRFDEETSPANASKPLGKEMAPTDDLESTSKERGPTDNPKFLAEEPVLTHIAKHLVPGTALAHAPTFVDGSTQVPNQTNTNLVTFQDLHQFRKEAKQELMKELVSMYSKDKSVLKGEHDLDDVFEQIEQLKETVHHEREQRLKTESQVMGCQQQQDISRHEYLKSIEDRFEQLKQLLEKNLQRQKREQAETETDSQNETLKSFSHRIQALEEQTKTVEPSIRKLQEQSSKSFMERLDLIHSNIEKMKDKYKDLESTLQEKYKDLESRLQEKYKDFESTLQEKHKDLESTLQEKYKDLESTLQEKHKDLESTLQEKHNVLESRLTLEIKQFHDDEKISNLVKALTDRVGVLEEQNLATMSVGNQVKDAHQSLAQRVETLGDETKARIDSLKSANIAQTATNEKAETQLQEHGDQLSSLKTGIDSQTAKLETVETLRKQHDLLKFEHCIFAEKLDKVESDSQKFDSLLDHFQYPDDYLETLEREHEVQNQPHKDNPKLQVTEQSQENAGQPSQHHQTVNYLLIAQFKSRLADQEARVNQIAAGLARVEFFSEELSDNVLYEREMYQQNLAEIHEFTGMDKAYKGAPSTRDCVSKLSTPPNEPGTKAEEDVRDPETLTAANKPMISPTTTMDDSETGLSNI